MRFALLVVGAVLLAVVIVPFALRAARVQSSDGGGSSGRPGLPVWAAVLIAVIAVPLIILSWQGQ